MKAFAITPGKAGSGHLRDVPEPQQGPGVALVEVLEVGVDGTDRELLSGAYGAAPPGQDYLITGHEALGRVLEAPPGTLRPGQLVVAIVRRPDPVPCANCAAGEWDMCLNGQYTERGIKGAHGFLTHRYTEDPRYLVSAPESLLGCAVLLEPLSIVEKALDQIRKIQSRAIWNPQRALVLGSGSIGTLASLLLLLEGLDVRVYSRGDGGPGRDIAERAGATFHSADKGSLKEQFRRADGDIDIVIEATGYSPLAFQAIDMVGPNGIVCLTGVSAGSRQLRIDAAQLNLEMVLMNKVVFGTVNANRTHFESGIAHMQMIEARWPGLLASMITRRIWLEDYSAADLERPNELKVVVQIPRQDAQSGSG